MIAHADFIPPGKFRHRLGPDIACLGIRQPLANASRRSRFPGKDVNCAAKDVQAHDEHERWPTSSQIMVDRLAAVSWKRRATGEKLGYFADKRYEALPAKRASPRE